MAIYALLARLMDRYTRRLGYRVFPDSVLHPSQIAEIDESDEIAPSVEVPDDAASYLHRGNERLLELRRLYAGLDEEVRTPLVWTEEFAAAPNLTTFRGDNMWVHQLGNRLQEQAHLLSTYYLLANDRLGLMQRLTEDGAFGALTYEFAGRLISRDLLDSILEIDFLDRHLHIASRDDLSILDIGAGYGRLAHRMMAAFPSFPTYRCTDVIAESSFVCEYYLRFRGLQDRCAMTPATEIESVLQRDRIDLAINIHSFSECTLNAVGWWVDRLANHRVKNLMIAPNAGTHSGQFLRNNVGQDMLHTIERRGYRLIARDSKFLDPKVQKHGLNPTYHWLFEFAR